MTACWYQARYVAQIHVNTCQCYNYDYLAVVYRTILYCFAIQVRQRSVWYFPYLIFKVFNVSVTTSHHHHSKVPALQVCTWKRVKKYYKWALVWAWMLLCLFNSLHSIITLTVMIILLCNNVQMTVQNSILMSSIQCSQWHYCLNSAHIR